VNALRAGELNIDAATVSSRADLAYAAIKRDIIGCLLEPGRRISKAELSARYDLGQSVIREALNRLYQEGLVFPIPREGYQVAPITLQQIHDLFGARLVLEPGIARLAAGRVDGDYLWQLDARCRALYHFADRQGLASYVGANSAFHMAVARASGNARLAEMLAMLLDEMERVMHLSYLLGERGATGGPGHGRQIEALIAGDGDRAAAASEKLLRADRQFVLDAFMSTSRLQAVSLTVPPGQIVQAE